MASIKAVNKTLNDVLPIQEWNYDVLREHLERISPKRKQNLREVQYFEDLGEGSSRPLEQANSGLHPSGEASHVSATLHTSRPGTVLQDGLHDATNQPITQTSSDAIGYQLQPFLNQDYDEPDFKFDPQLFSNQFPSLDVQNESDPNYHPIDQYGTQDATNQPIAQTSSGAIGDQFQPFPNQDYDEPDFKFDPQLFSNQFPSLDVQIESDPNHPPIDQYGTTDNYVPVYDWNLLPEQRQIDPVAQTYPEELLTYWNWDGSQQEQDVTGLRAGLDQYQLSAADQSYMQASGVATGLAAPVPNPLNHPTDPTLPWLNPSTSPIPAGQSSYLSQSGSVQPASLQTDGNKLSAPKPNGAFFDAPGVPARGKTRPSILKALATTDPVQFMRLYPNDLDSEFGWIVATSFSKKKKFIAELDKQHRLPREWTDKPVVGKKGTFAKVPVIENKTQNRISKWISKYARYFGRIQGWGHGRFPAPDAWLDPLTWREDGCPKPTGIELRHHVVLPNEQKVIAREQREKLQQEQQEKQQRELQGKRGEPEEQEESEEQGESEEQEEFEEHGESVEHGESEGQGKLEKQGILEEQGELEEQVESEEPEEQVEPEEQGEPEEQAELEEQGESEEQREPEEQAESEEQGESKEQGESEEQGEPEAKRRRTKGRIMTGPSTINSSARKILRGRTSPSSSSTSRRRITQYSGPLNAPPSNRASSQQPPLVQHGYSGSVGNGRGNVKHHNEYIAGPTSCSPAARIPPPGFSVPNENLGREFQSPGIPDFSSYYETPSDDNERATLDTPHTHARFSAENLLSKVPMVSAHDQQWMEARQTAESNLNVAQMLQNFGWDGRHIRRSVHDLLDFTATYPDVESYVNVCGIPEPELEDQDPTEYKKTQEFLALLMRVILDKCWDKCRAEFERCAREKGWIFPNRLEQWESVYDQWAENE